MALRIGEGVAIVDKTVIGVQAINTMYNRFSEQDASVLALKGGEWKQEGYNRFKTGIPLVSTDTTLTFTFDATVSRRIVKFGYSREGSYYRLVVIYKEGENNGTDERYVQMTNGNSHFYIIGGTGEPFNYTINVNSELIMRCEMRVRIGEDENLVFFFTSNVLGAPPIKANTGTTPNISQLSLSTCPRLRAYGSTDPLTGNNFSMAVLMKPGKVYIRYPCLTVVTKGKECTLVGKLAEALEVDDTAEDFLRYSLLVYFLWYLITNKWTVCILKRSRSAMFFKALKSSEYACWIEYFESEGLLRYRKYFVK